MDDKIPAIPRSMDEKHQQAMREAFDVTLRDLVTQAREVARINEGIAIENVMAGRLGSTDPIHLAKKLNLLRLAADVLRGYVVSAEKLEV